MCYKYLNIDEYDEISGIYDINILYTPSETDQINNHYLLIFNQNS